MDYEKNYYNYINYVKTLNRSKKDNIYYEEHHIKPKSIYPELKNEKSNLVLLTARERFLAHYLLCKFQKNEQNELKMLYAFNKMMSGSKFNNQNNLRYYNSKLYEYLRKRRSELISKALKKHKSYCKGKTYEELFGKQKADELKKNRSIAMSKNWKKGVYLNFIRKPHSEETKRKIGEKSKNRRWHTSKVICLETKEIFESIKNANNKYGPIGIGASCRSNGIKLAGGYHWKYYYENQDISIPENARLHNRHVIPVINITTNTKYASIKDAKKDYPNSNISLAITKNHKAGGCVWKKQEDIK
jgi:hypothetical protein